MNATERDTTMTDTEPAACCTWTPTGFHDYDKLRALREHNNAVHRNAAPKVVHHHHYYSGGVPSWWWAKVGRVQP